MNRKYIAAVVPLPDHILQVDFVSGSRLLLDMKPYLDKFRFRPLSDPGVWNSMGSAPWQQAADPVGPAVSDYLPEPAARNSPGGPGRQQRQQPHGVRRPGLRHQGPGGL